VVCIISYLPRLLTHSLLDIQIYLENPPQDDSERWSGRPYRALTVVNPPSAAGSAPKRTEFAKHRFLEQLWHAQALYRTKAGQSVALRAEESDVESRGNRITVARTYFNIFQRTAFLKEAKKTKIVLHIDESGSADPIPFGSHGPPYVVVRVQPMAGELCRYIVTSNDPNDEEEEDIIQTVRVPTRIIQTSKRFELII
jgi:protein ECT2